MRFVRKHLRFWFSLLSLTLIVTGSAWAASPASVSGVVRNPMGAVVAGATAVLQLDGKPSATTTSDRDGKFTFTNVAVGRYQIQVTASGFTPRLIDPFFVGAQGTVTVEIVLSIGVKAQVVVTAAATELTAAEVAAPVTVIDRSTIDALAQPDVLDSLRLVPGVQVLQTGERGGGTSLFIRGGNANFNKVLIDGIAANDIGGRFEFGDLSTTGVERVEVARDANSVLHGSDAIAGVVGVTTRRGRTRTPELSYTGDVGNFGTTRSEIGIGGAVRRFDYYTAVSEFRTDNHVPNSHDRNRTVASRFGVTLGQTVLTATAHWYGAQAGSPNAFAFYGIADDSRVQSHATLAGVTAETHLSAQWRSTIRFSVSDQHYAITNPAPTGTPYDPFGFGANFLGQMVTITGGNGFSTTGRAILDYGGSYPSRYESSARRTTLSGEATYRPAGAISLSMGGRTDHETGTSRSSFSDTGTTRNNGGAFAELRAAGRRVLASVGVGAEHNAIFGNAFTPRGSIAFFAREAHDGWITDTRIVANAGKGIKAPTIDQENSSLFGVLGPASAATLGVSPVGPERARTLDVGVDQGLAHGRVRARVSAFFNRYSGLLEFVDKTALPLLGVSQATLNQISFGAYANASSYRARGVEASVEASIRSFTFVASYLFLNATVTKSLSSSTLAPAENPAFPGVLIGAFAPLEGARPFRRPTHSGNLFATWTHRAFQAAVSAVFAGRSDDSTFLSDQDFGNSMLLPNHNLARAYQKVDVSAAYRFHPRVLWFVSLENVANQAYQPAAGYPGLPRSVRTGLTITVGGDRRQP